MHLMRLHPGYIMLHPNVTMCTKWDPRHLWGTEGGCRLLAVLRRAERHCVLLLELHRLHQRLLWQDAHGLRQRLCQHSCTWQQLNWQVWKRICIWTLAGKRLMQKRTSS